MMDRRGFLLVSLASALGEPLAAGAQQVGRCSGLAYLGQSRVELIRGDESLFRVFRDRLQELGYAAGSNVIFERRWPEGKLERLPQLAQELIAALKVTFSDEKFEQYLRDQAADTEQIAARRAERENLIQTIPKLAAAEAKLAKAIAVSDDMDALVAELKATQQERRQAEARVADLEGYERDLRDQQEQVERLRRVWGGWAAALDADVPTARQILKKILVGRIYVRPVGPGAWRFAGISRYDGALRGGLGRTGTDVLPGFGPRYDDFCQLMLHLLAEPKSAWEWTSDPGPRESLQGLCLERRTRAIAGGSDAGDQTGRVSSGPPIQ